MLTLIHNKMIPKVTGTVTNIDITEKLYLSKIL